MIFRRVLIALDQTLNCCVKLSDGWGWPDETLSARAYRLREPHPALRPLYHLFGQSTRNAGGVICSEMVADDLKANGWAVRFNEVPSPADLEQQILGRKNAIKE